MVDVAIALDDVAEVADYSNATIQALAARLERSTTFQELIGREIELDELWRRVETALKAAAEAEAARQGRGGERQALERLFAHVTAAHDLAGQGRPLDAAAQLRDALALRADTEQDRETRPGHLTV